MTNVFKRFWDGLAPPSSSFLHCVASLSLLALCCLTGATLTAQSVLGDLGWSNLPSHG